MVNLAQRYEEDIRGTGEKTSESVWILWRREHLLPQQGIELRFLGSPPFSTVIIPTDLLGQHVTKYSFAQKHFEALF